MTIEELKALRLAHQHLLAPADSLRVAGDLCGLQAQFFGSALHALRIRTGKADVRGLVKSWTLRGTVHLFPEADLPLYVRRRAAPEDVCDSDWYRWCAGRGHAIPPERDRRFARVITDGVAAGVDTREALRLLCRREGMTDAEEAYVFNGWGGTIAELASLGVLCFKPQQEKAYRLCPDFTPLEEETAHVELARRYFTHYGPATLRDAAYFFRVPQAQVKRWLAHLPVESFPLEGRLYFHLPQPGTPPPLPRCLMLAGFDQLMLGYRKEDNPFLPPEHLRGIFNLAGIVLPGVLLDGRIVARWKYEKGLLRITCFQSLEESQRRAVLDAAQALWTLRRVQWT